MKKSSTRNRSKKAAPVDSTEVAKFFVRNSQFLLPFINLFGESKMMVDEIIDCTGRAVIEAILTLSAKEVAGEKSQGKRVDREEQIRWHGTQAGRVVLSDRKLHVERPRLRKSSKDGKEEVAIPAYEAMQNDAVMGARMTELLLGGLTTRGYHQMIREMAETAGVSKSSVSREFVEASAEKVREINERRLEGKHLLSIYIDGLVFGEHHVIASVGVDASGNKHILGLALGSTENSVVVKDLLVGLVERGLEVGVARLFIIDGSKALRCAIREVFGEWAQVQRCRAHKIRNVLSYLPKELGEQVATVMRAAYKLGYAEGMAKLKAQAEWLRKEYPQATESLLEGLEETFTVNRLGLSQTLRRSFGTTNIIENPNGSVRVKTRRVSRWRNGEMVMRWAAASFLEAEKKFRKVMGYRELWMLEGALKEVREREEGVAKKEEVA